MTAAEATTLRTSLMTQFQAWIDAGAPTSYMINGRSKTVDAEFWLRQILILDSIIARANNGGFLASQLRPAE